MPYDATTALTQTIVAQQAAATVPLVYDATTALSQALAAGTTTPFDPTK